MSEFYLVRRNSIADMTAFFGFLVGFLGSAPIAWPFLQVGFQTGEITKGFAYFISIICGAGVVCGAIGLVLGRAGGWLWERGHRFLRAPEAAGTVSRRPDPARAARDRAIVATLGGGSSEAAAAVPGVRFETDSPDPAAYLALLGRAGVVADDEAALERALRRSTNAAAWDGTRLVGIGRALTDGHRYAVLAELIVDPDYRRRGIGRELIRRLRAVSPASLSTMQSTAGCQELLEANPVSRKDGV